MAGWWFETFFNVPYIGLLIIPTDELVFFRGVAKNHQPEIYCFKFFPQGFGIQNNGENEEETASAEVYFINNGSS